MASAILLNEYPEKQSLRVRGELMGLELEIIHVFRSYNGNPILRDCSFSFTSGRTYALHGPNGSGKSTLFPRPALLEKPDSGRVEYRNGGQILAADLALRRRITPLIRRRPGREMPGFFRATASN